MEVEILCTKKIKPASPTPPHLRTLKLSPFDPLHSVKVAINFYYSAHTSTRIEEVKSRNARLEKSLSETLSRFYPLAGRYIRHGNWIDCNDEGVEYLEAKVKGRFSELLSKRDDMIHLLGQFAGGESTDSLASVQVNMFDCGGLVIGTRLSHTLCDGFSGINFIASWATASREGIDGVIWPYFDVSSILPTNGLPMLKQTPPVRRTGNTMTVTRRFVLDESKISSLKARAHDPSFQLDATRVEVVTALIWRTLMGVSLARHGHLRTSIACHSMNLRSKIVPPLPPVCIGNLYTRVVAKFVPQNNGNMDLLELKDLVSLVRDAFTKSKQTVVPQQQVLSTMINISNEIYETIERGEVDVFHFISLCRFPLYEVDFGRGKPVWVSRIHMPPRMISLMETEGGDGVEVWVSLDKPDMDRFLQDEDILALTSNEAL